MLSNKIISIIYTDSFKNRFIKRTHKNGVSFTLLQKHGNKWITIYHREFTK